MTLIQVTICFKTPRRVIPIGNAKLTTSDEGMLWIWFDDEKRLGYPLRDILYVECEPVKP